jgi:hypothetical protein
MSNPLMELNARRTPEERQAAAKKAAEASVVARRRAKSWREAAQLVLSGELSNEEAQRARATLNLPEDLELTQREAILAAGAERAKKGDKDWATFLRDTAGENPQILIKVGNLDDKPFAMLELGSLSDAQLRAIAERERPDSLDSEPEIIDLEPVAEGTEIGLHNDDSEG